MKRRGFTLIEIMFVMAIAGAITAMAFVGISSLKRDGRDKERMSDRDLIGTAIKAYQSAREGELPTLGTNPAANQIVVDGSNQRLLDTSPLITGGYLSSSEGYRDPLARDGSGRIAYRMVDGPPGACPAIDDSNSAVMFYDPDSPPGKSFRLSVCLEAGTLNDKDFEM